MNRRLEVRLSARIDLLDHFAWLHDRSPQSALRFLDRAHDTFEFLRRNAHAGRPWPRPPRRLTHLRVIRLTGFERVLVFYRPVRSAVQIVRVIHSARDLETALRSR